MAPPGLAALLSILALAGCGPEATSFRTTEASAEADLPGPPRAVYTVEIGGRRAARVQVWSSGGYVATTEEPMTHVGFEIENLGARPLVFDGDALKLTVYDKTATALPPTRFTTITPLGPAQIEIAPGATLVLASYFLLPVRPRVVGSMQLQWSVLVDHQRHLERTRFVRDDDGSVLDRPSESELRTTRAPGARS